MLRCAVFSSVKVAATQRKVNSRSRPNVLHNVARDTRICWRELSVQTRNYATKKKKADADADGEVAPKKSASAKAAVQPLEAVIKKIEQSFGAGTVMKLDPSSQPTKPVDVISTGSLSLDLALGVGGLPRGRIIEIFGPESSGKTTLALQVIAQAQARGDNCCFIDAEHALDVAWAKKLGVSTDKLLVCQPDSGEQALEIADTLAQSESIGVIVVDSVAALVPRQELEGEMGQLQIGLQARLMSQALRKLTPIVAKSNAMVIFINQIRMKIGVMFGNPETTSGGVSLKYYASVRLDIRKIGSVKRGDIVVANQMRVKVAKNKVAPPFRTAEFDIEFGKGLSKSGEIIDLGLREKVIEKSGAWYSVVGSGLQLGQGREKAKQFLEENPDVSAQLEKSIREIGLAAKDKTPVSEDAAADAEEESSIDALLDPETPTEGTDRA